METYLAHHGIKGMKWGVRKSEIQSSRVKKKHSNSLLNRNEVSARKAAVSVSYRITCNNGNQRPLINP